MKRFVFTKDELKRRTEIHFCIVCGRYCTHEHHLVTVKYSGNGKAKNKIWVCKLHHKHIHKGWIKIPVSRLPIETINYIKDKEIAGDCIDWNN